MEKIIFVLVVVLCFGIAISWTEDDPEVYMRAKDLIIHNGYPVEIHNITTADGFILEAQRIKNGKRKTITVPGKPVVLLQHGLMVGSDCFLMESNSSLAYILADAGMDVWLSNSRGNSYGMKHTRYNPKQEQFWAWSFDEMARYDLPAVIDYVLQTTNRSKLYYIGHSQGTNIAFAAFSQNQTLADKVKLFIAMSPIAQVQHIKGLMKWISDVLGGRTQHGLMVGSDCFLMESNSSLAYILADAGMDVWLSNSRGNSYGMKHTRYNPKQEQFWAWSFDEMARYDLPAVIDYVLQTTNRSKLYYIGHSQGTNIAFAAFSQNQTLADKVKLFIAMSPIAQVQHIKGLMKWISDVLGGRTQEMFAIFGRKSFATNSTFVMDYATKLCGKAAKICATAVSLIDGFDTRQVNMSRVPRYLAHATEGTSVQNIVHYAQEVRSGLYQKFDYGSPTENVKHYNQTTPPVYDLKKMKTPVAIYYGGRDWLADREDVKYVERELSKNTNHVEYIGLYNHLDFVIAMDAPMVLYPDIITTINRTENPTKSFLYN